MTTGIKVYDINLVQNMSITLSECATLNLPSRTI